MIKKLIKHQVFRNFSYLTVGSLLSQLIGVFTIIRITQIFSPDNYGTYTFIISQGTLLFTVADLGITNVVIRTIARDKQRTRDIIFNGALIRFFAVLCITLLYITYNYFFGSLSALQVVFVYSFALVTCFTHLFEIAFTGNQKMLPVSLINISYSIVWLSVVMLLPAKYFTITYLFTAFLILNVLKALVSFTVLRSKNLLAGNIGKFWISSKALIKESWPYFALMLIMLPATYLSNNFLQLNSKIAEVGYFNLSQKILAPADLILGFALSALFPNLSALWTEDEPRFKRLVSAGFKYFMLAGLVPCFLFTLFANEIVSLVFKPGYLPAAAVCQVQVWYIFLIAVSSLTGTILSAVNKEKLVLQSGIVSALVATPLLFWGSKYGALGLSYGYITAFGVSMIYVWYLFKKGAGIKIQHDLLLWLLVIVLFIISYFMLQHISIIYRLILGLLVTGGVVLYFFKTGKTMLAK